MLWWDDLNASPLSLCVLTLPSKPTITMTLYIEAGIGQVAYDRYSICCCRQLILCLVAEPGP